MERSKNDGVSVQNSMLLVPQRRTQDGNQLWNRECFILFGLFESERGPEIREHSALVITGVAFAFSQQPKKPSPMIHPLGTIPNAVNGECMDQHPLPLNATVFPTSDLDSTTLRQSQGISVVHMGHCHLRIRCEGPGD
jgi:hypothetical protein